MIDTEHVKCDTCTAPEPMELDASDEASRGWPTVDIETNPYKAQFPLFQQHPEIAFLDSAATAQRPACVLDAERDFYQRMNANPLRGLYSLSVEATEAIAKVRQQIADLLGAAQAKEVVFTRNTSESLNLVAKSFAPTVLEPGDEVVITIMEHHSNLIPWQQVCRETVEEARRLAELFLAMIRGEKLSEEDLEDLDEAAQLQDISHMPARVKCAELAWRTLDGMLEGRNNQ